MKKWIFTLLAAVTAFTVQAQDEVAFEFSDGIDNAALKSRMEQQVSRLLTAINKAESSNGYINFNGIKIDPMASQSITALWENVRFRCVDDDIVEHCLSIKGNGRVKEYQIRNIPIEMKPVDQSYTDDLYQEVCINFTPTGTISDFNITMGIQQYTKIMKEGATLKDFNERMQIVGVCDQLKTAYNKKDIQFIEKIFSNDALIITGKVITTKHAEGFTSQKIQYNKQSKQQYIQNLRGVFKRNSHINVDFVEESISVKRHPVNPKLYGVTLRQKWTSGAYHDDGWLFLVWDFTDEDAPQIHVRTWQPAMLNGKPLPEDEIMSFDDIDI